MPYLRVLAGPTLEALEPISNLVNTDKSYRVSSPFFEGELVAHIRDFVNEQGEQVPDGPYFNQEGKSSITWSIMTRGRFLVPINADDILFGNVFDRPLSLPWGTSAALKFASFIDPTLEHDLASPTKPWALSPLISTMPNFAHRRVAGCNIDQSDTPFPPKAPLRDFTDELHHANLEHPSPISLHPSHSSASVSIDTVNKSSKAHKSSSSLTLGRLASAARSVSSLALDSAKSNCRKFPDQKYQFSSASHRRRHFSDTVARQEVIFGPGDFLDTDFCYGFFSFSPTITLKIPGGLEFDLMRYWDKQPVRFVCCARKGWSPPASYTNTPASSLEDSESDEDSVNDDTPWGQVFWCMAIEVVD